MLKAVLWVLRCRYCVESVVSIVSVVVIVNDGGKLGCNGDCVVSVGVGVCGVGVSVGSILMTT